MDSSSTVLPMMKAMTNSAAKSNEKLLLVHRYKSLIPSFVSLIVLVHSKLLFVALLRLLLILYQKSINFTLAKLSLVP